jgi:hypothetical protein
MAEMVLMHALSRMEKKSGMKVLINRALVRCVSPTVQPPWSEQAMDKESPTGAAG